MPDPLAVAAAFEILAMADGDAVSPANLRRIGFDSQGRTWAAKHVRARAGAFLAAQFMTLHDRLAVLETR